MSELTREQLIGDPRECVQMKALQPDLSVPQDPNEYIRQLSLKIVVLLENVHALEQQVVMLTAKVELKDRIIKGCVDDLCELETEMEKFGMEFTDDYGGLHVPEVISTFIKALTAKVAEVERERDGMRIYAQSMQQVADNNYAMWQSHKESLEIMARDLAASEARVAKLEEALKVLVDAFAGTTKGKRYQSRYEHGGGRLFVDEGNILGHTRQLIADTYAEGDREFIYLCYETLAALSQDGVRKE